MKKAVKVARRGRNKLPEGEKKVTVNIFLEQRIVEKLTKERIRVIAEKAVQAEYEAEIA